MPRFLAVALLVALALSFIATPSHAFRIGVGGFGFRNYNLADPPHTDFDNGALYGAKARLALIPLLGIEPMLTFVDYGDYDVDGRRVEASMTAFELNAILGGAGGGLGLHLYSLFGLGSYRVDTDPGDAETKAGWTIGTGMEIVPWPSIGIDGSIRFRWVNTEETAIKDLGIYLGVNYYLGS